jgi:hypothetical protein
MICRDCQEEFEKKKNEKRGFANQCDDCSSGDETNRYVGYNDGTLNKSQNISVYRGTSAHVKKTLLGFRMV